MSSIWQTNRAKIAHTVEWVLALVGAVNCVVIPFFFSQNQDPLFPLPGLYLIEIALLGILGLVSIMRDQVQNASYWGAIPWLVAGGLLAFVILGAWTIGLFLMPAMVAFLIAGILAGRRQSRKLSPHIGLFVLAAVVQAGIMLGLLLLSPNVQWG
jgi:hypothetical protein